MKKLAALLVLLLAVLTALAALDFTSVDDLYDAGTDYQKVYDTLQTMLKEAKSNEEKSEVLWRLSRVCVDLGDALPEKDKNGKYAIYDEGEQYALKSIEAKPNYLAYLWKCANVGRYGQTKGVMDSLGKVKPMKADLKVITDDFKVLDSSEAWYTLAVLNDAVPGILGGDSVAAISYMRIACETIPAKYVYGGTYKALAEMLYSRNWSASKRAKEIASLQKKWDKETKSNFDKYAYYEGSKGADAVPVWSTKKLSEMSDREEALAVLKYAQQMYNSKSFKTGKDAEHYAEIQDLITQWSK
ncbi:MAG: hypothetical protein J5775_06520 [Spirochaetales bacterium]|nr:hypothetical protein [Spirochaetales bacterium]